MKTYTDDELARRLYGIAAERMQAANRQMPCSEAVFSVLTAAAPDAVSYPAMAQLGNADFLEAAYLLLLGRPLQTIALFGLCACLAQTAALVLTFLPVELKLKHTFDTDGQRLVGRDM